jgi:hypothetical protein
VTDAFTELAGALGDNGVQFVVSGVWGANYYAAGRLFVTQDQDLFLPLDAPNLLRAWQVCSDRGLELAAGSEPLDQPRDLTLANAVVRANSLTTATDGRLLQVDLSLVMTGLDFASVWSRRRRFSIDGVEIPVASLVDILAAKRAANRPKDRLFLATHAEELRRLLGRG